MSRNVASEEVGELRAPKHVAWKCQASHKGDKHHQQ